MERAAGGPRERLERVLDELERQRADPLAAERQVDDGVRAAADVHDGGRERLVHRDRAVTEALDPGSVAERLGEGGAQDERDVLGRVVLVDLQVAVGAHREIEQAVVGERSEQVVVEADARVDRGVAGTIEAERDRDLGLVRRPGERDPAAVLARAERHVPERAGHAPVSLAMAVAAAMNRSFSSVERIVSAQVIGQRVAVREGPWHEAVAQQTLGDRLGRGRPSRSRRG